MSNTARRRRWPWIFGPLFLVAILLVGWFFQGQYGIPSFKDEPAYTKEEHKPIGTKDLKPEDVTVTGQKVPADIKATQAAKSVKSSYNTVPNKQQLNNSRQKGKDVYLEELSPILEIGPSGKLPAPMQVTIKLDRKVVIQPAKKGKPQDKVYIATNTTHEPNGWVMQEAKVSSDGQYATIVIDHLSWFQALWSNVTGMWNELKDQFLDGMTSGIFAEAKKPTCQNESQARAEDYRINSDSKNTIYWCFGVEKGERIVRIVNNRKYPLEVKTDNLNKIGWDTFRMELADLWRMSGKQLLMPGDTVTYKVALKHDGRATIDTDISKMGLGLHSVETVALSIGTLIAKVDLTKPKKAGEVLKKLFEKRQCVGVLSTMNMGDLIRECFDATVLFQNFGPSSVILAPVMAVFSLASVGQSLWEAYNDGKNGQATYNVTVTRPKPNPFGPLAGEWGRHLSQIILREDGTGFQSVSSGAGGVEGCGTGDNYCALKANLSLSPGSNGSIIATFTKVWYVFGESQIVPTPPDWMISQPQAGDSMQIKAREGDTIEIIMLGRLSNTNKDWDVYGGHVYCGSSAVPPASLPCGA